MFMHIVIAGGLSFAPEAPATTGPDLDTVWQDESGTIHAGGETFTSWQAFRSSPAGRAGGSRRCGHVSNPAAGEFFAPSDCSFTFTNPAAEYAPSVAKYRIPVVVHVIRNNSGTQGNVSMALINSQIDVLNEDFLAIAGSLGGSGTDVQIEFYLATEDPNGNATNGVTYSNNTQWYNDNGSYWNALAWDTNRYLNIYTNTAGGALGYVPDLPQGGIAGSNEDRVVVAWDVFGRNAPAGAPFNLGRTATHEVGHYLGLEHTFNGGCGSSSACYSTGDLICDTNRQANPTEGCGGSSCGSSNPTDNYMDYSDDECMERFTPEQARRMRCSLIHYRPDLGEIEEEACAGDFDADNTVGFADLVSLLSSFGTCSGCEQDLDGNSVVDFSDLLSLLSLWGNC